MATQQVLLASRHVVCYSEQPSSRHACGWRCSRVFHTHPCLCLWLAEPSSGLGVTAAIIMQEPTGSSSRQQAGRWGQVWLASGLRRAKRRAARSAPPADSLHALHRTSRNCRDVAHVAISWCQRRRQPHCNGNCTAPEANTVAFATGPDDDPPPQPADAGAGGHGGRRRSPALLPGRLRGAAAAGGPAQPADW